MMLRNIIYSPLSSLFLVVISSSFFLTFISVKINIIDGSQITLGLIHSAFYGGMLIGSLKSEEIINRIGHIRAFTLFSSILTFIIILQALYQIPKFWILLRFFSGLATAAIYIIIESWLLAQANQKNKGKILSIYMICLYSAQTIGQFGIDIVDINTIEPFLFAALLASISIIPAALTYTKAPEIKPLPKMAVIKYFKASPIGFIGCVVSGLILSGIYGFLPNYAMDNNISVSILLGVTITGGFVLQWPIGKLSDMFNRIKIVTLLVFMITVLCLTFTLVPLEGILVYIFSFFLGGFSFALYPLCIAQVCDCVNNSNIINIASSLLFAYGIGAVTGPIVLAFCIKIYSSIAVLYYISIISCFLLFYCLYSFRTIKGISQKDQVKFVVVPRVLSVASAITPRLDDKK